MGTAFILTVEEREYAGWTGWAVLINGCEHEGGFESRDAAEQAAAALARELMVETLLTHVVQQVTHLMAN